MNSNVNTESELVLKEAASMVEAMRNEQAKVAAKQQVLSQSCRESSHQALSKMRFILCERRRLHQEQINRWIVAVATAETTKERLTSEISEIEIELGRLTNFPSL